MGTAATLMYIWKILISSLSGGTVYAELRKDMTDHPIFSSLVVAISLLIFIGTIGDLFFHIKGADGKHPFWEVVFNVYVKNDEDTLYWQNIISHQEPLEKCQTYIEKYPKGKYVEDANKCIEKRVRENDVANFEKAKSTNTIKAYLQYMSADNANFIQEAKNRISTLEKLDAEKIADWKEIETTQTLEQCQSYLSKYSDSNQARTCIAQRKIEIDNQNFENAVNINTISAYTDYINKCTGECENKRKAEQNILELKEQEKIVAWKQIEATHTLEQCQSYLSKYSDSMQAKSCITQRKTEIDNQNYENAINENTIFAYDFYINNCNKNTCENKIKAEQNIFQLTEQEKIVAWKKIELTQTLEQCQAYLAKYKDSEQANSCIALHKREIDNQNYVATVNVNTIAAYNEYLYNCNKNTCENKIKAEQNIVLLREQEEIVARQRRKISCDQNEAEAQSAKSKAEMKYGAGGGAATGGGCTALLALGFIDFGASAAACYILGGAATVAASADAGEKAYIAVRDPQCL